MSRYRLRVQLIEWYGLGVDGDSPRQAMAEAEELPPSVIRKHGKLLSTETGLADSASIALIAAPLPSEMHAAPLMHNDGGPPPGLHPKVPSAHVLRRKPSTLVDPRSESRQRIFIGPKAFDIAAPESPPILPSSGPSATHNWAQPDGRRIELQPGKTLMHWRCTNCRRSFVHDLTTEEWYVVFPRVLDFERLDVVSAHWLTEDCSGHYQAADEQARKMRIDKDV